MIIKTSMQLKALIRNQAKGNNTQARLLMCNYAMERYLERISLSKYKDNLILKGGCLMASIIGLNKRLTMDMDLTAKSLFLDDKTVADIVEEIAKIHVDDGMTFEIKSVKTVMSERKYAGANVSLDAKLDNTHIPIKIDFSIGDVITPKEIAYKYNLMFGNKSISIMAYNLETVVAEKMSAIFTRSTANTRMKDFYDIYILYSSQMHNIDVEILSAAFSNTCQQRDLSITDATAVEVINNITEDANMQKDWARYTKQFDFASDISWGDVMQAVKGICEYI